MQFTKRLPEVEEIRNQYPLSEQQKIAREIRLNEIKYILERKDKRKLLLMGPCSADREDAVIDYITKLAELQESVKDIFLIVPRVYTSKPRTNGAGYKGMLHRPESNCGQDDLLAGLIATRRMHLHIIQQTGMFCVDEMLYPESIYYLLDLLVCVTVGARSVENQEHRLVASGLGIPVGMKNPMSGDLSVMLNSVMAAQMKQCMIYRGWEVTTEGNQYCFAILRGYKNNCNKVFPNYHYENLCELYDMYQKQGLKNMSVVIDCNHGNSDKHYERQVRIAREVFGICKEDRALNEFVKGIMLESYLEDGSQLIGNGVYGKSITDSCLGWKKSEELILELAQFYS